MLCPRTSICDNATRSRDRLKNKHSHPAAAANDSSFDSNRRKASSTTAPIIKSIGLFTLFSMRDRPFVAIMPHAVENKRKNARHPEPIPIAFFQSHSRMARKKNGTKSIGPCYTQEHRFQFLPQAPRRRKMKNAFRGIAPVAPLGEVLSHFASLRYPPEATPWRPLRGGRAPPGARAAARRFCFSLLFLFGGGAGGAATRHGDSF